MVGINSGNPGAFEGNVGLTLVRTWMMSSRTQLADLLSEMGDVFARDEFDSEISLI